MSEKAIKLINDLRRDISIDIMFTPEKNAEDDSLKQLVDYIAELEGENAGLKEELQQEKTRSQLNLEAEERRMLNITYYCAEIDRLHARIAELEEENDRLQAAWFVEETICPDGSLFERCVISKGVKTAHGRVVYAVSLRGV